MKLSDQRRALAAAIHAARKAGQLMRANLHRAKVVNESSSHDIKLQLDVRCQQVITRALHRAFPGIALLGEEGDSGRADTAYRWVVDPIDGTVNFAYSIPHASVSIALQERIPGNAGGRGDYKTVLGVVLDPFLDEVWTATEFDPPRLNGRPIRVSKRRALADTIVAMGFGKTRATTEESLQLFARLSRTSLRVRSMGSAALALVYVACGRFDAYVERGISLWDIAAGGFIVERAGGTFWREPLRERLRYRMITSNGLLHRRLHQFFLRKGG